MKKESLIMVIIVGLLLLSGMSKSKIEDIYLFPKNADPVRISSNKIRINSEGSSCVGVRRNSTYNVRRIENGFTHTVQINYLADKCILNTEKGVVEYNDVELISYEYPKSFAHEDEIKATIDSWDNLYYKYDYHNEPFYLKNTSWYSQASMNGGAIRLYINGQIDPNLKENDIL